MLDQRKVTFATGYGLEGVLPDALCFRIQQNEMRVMKREELQDAIHEMLTTEGPFLLEACVIEEGNVLPMTPPGSSVNQMLLEC